MPIGKGIYHAPWEKSFDRILTPLEEFIHRQTTSGVLLMICAVVALVIANGPLHDQYEHFLHTEIGINMGSFVFSLSIHQSGKRCPIAPATGSRNEPRSAPIPARWSSS